MLELIKSITKKEWKFWVKVLIVLLLLTSLSRIFIFIIIPEDSLWTGRIIFSPVDRYVYVSYIEQVRSGSYLLEDLYTHKEESTSILNIFWLGAGLLARITGWSANFVLEFLRIIFACFLAFILYLLIAFFIKDIWQRKLSYLLVIFAGGLGAWFYPILEAIFKEDTMLYNLPVDINVSEAFVFLATYYSAHFLLSLLCMSGIILFTLLAIEKKKILYSVYAGLLGLILANFHPFSFLSVFLIFIVYWIFSLWKDRENFIFLLKFGFIFSIISLPSILYHLYMFGSPWWQNQTWSSNTESPNLVFVIVGYGFLLICSVGALFLEYKNKIRIKYFYFLLIWILTQFSLLILPISTQRRFLEGLSIGLSIVSSYFLVYFLKERQWIIKGKIFAGTAFILLFSFSFILIMILDFGNISQKGDLTYLSKEKAVALKYLKNSTKKDSTIVSDIYTSNMIPGMAMRRVFVGHGVETINFDEKYELLKQFMVNRDSAGRIGFLKNNKIDYFFYDGTWKDDWAFNPDEDEFLEKIYEKGIYKIYKVNIK